MKRKEFMSALAAASCLGWMPARAEAGLLSQADASLGVKAALEKGARAAVGSLGRDDGFFANPKVKIPLPKALEQASQLLKFTGQQKKVDELVLAMNRAAEAATPQAEALLLSAVKAMTVEDAIKIVRGGDTSVTSFFESKTREPLAEKFLPIVTQATEKLSLAEKYNAVAGKASGLGFVKKEDANIQLYVTRKALDGLFLMIGEEEQKIRKDPIGTGSELLKRVFG
jgi:hypothetical protein